MKGLMNAAPVHEGRGEESGNVISTVLGKCRRCFTCVRACPAKAIRFEQGQARVVEERCIACGNCVVVCAQHAKEYRSGLEKTLELLGGEQPVAALVAPSFPAEFFELDAQRLVGALRKLGFAYVVEVAHGADLVSAAYQRQMPHRKGPCIASACPAVNEYIRKYAPHLVEKLIPVVSPMIATARAVHAVYGEHVRCVFMGPCVAKKREAWDPQVAGEVDEVLTFREVRSLFERQGIVLDQQQDSDFDPPRAGLGRLYPLVGGLLKAMGHERNLLQPEAIVISGHQETLEVLGKLSGDESFASLIEPLMCRGCYSGPGMSPGRQRFERKQAVVAYVREQMKRGSEQDLAPSGDESISLSRVFVPDERRLAEPPEAELRRILAQTNKFSPSDELNCGACGYATCREKAVAVYHGLAEDAMCLPFMLEAAERVCEELKLPWLELREVQSHLVNSEKLVSLGQMAAGIAHELNNPLGTILLYAGILRKKLGNREDLRHDLDLLSDESQRCKRIIGSLLDFARQNRVKPESAKVARLFRDAVETSLANRDPNLQVRVEVSDDLQVEVDRDQLRQVLDNLCKNAAEAMEGRQGHIVLRGRDGPREGTVILSVSDQGCGMSKEAQDMIFQPFFTTKRIGKGTGLGLPIAYGIIKMHHGRIWVESEIGVGTTVFIELPRHRAQVARSVIE